MPPAARVGDASGHPGTLTGPGNPTVLVGGKPQCTIGDMHACSFPPPAGPHPPSPIVTGSATVLVGGKPAARIGDKAGCTAPIILGEFTVIIGG